MFQYIVTFLLAATVSLFGNNTQGLIAGDVSPAPKAATVENEADDTEESDDDIIIDEEDEDDDEDVHN